MREKREKPQRNRIDFDLKSEKEIISIKKFDNVKSNRFFDSISFSFIIKLLFDRKKN